MLQQVKEIPTTVTQGVGTVAGTTHKAMQASLGAAVIMQESVTTRLSNVDQEEIEIVIEESAETTIKFTQKLIDRGDETQKAWM